MTMKKVLIVIGIVVLVAVLDIAVRLLWPGDSDEDIQPVQVPLAPEAAVDGDQDRTGWLEGSSRDFGIRGKADLVRDRTICEDVSATLLAKKGAGLTRRDVESIRLLREEWARNEIATTILYYLTCRGLEEGSYAFCQEWEKLGLGPTAMQCSEVYAVLYAAVAAYYRKVDEQVFKAEIVGIAEPVRGATLEIFHATKDRNEDICSTFGFGEGGVGICRIIVNPPASAPANLEAANAYHLVRLLMTGQKEHLEKLTSAAPRLLGHTIIGEPGYCARFLTQDLASICEAL